jgi:7,8-dihydroneopterin aldolase/epimerase/oxygenase
MRDKITLSNMMFYGFHGVYEYEREQGQKFYLDVDIFTDLQKAGNSDLVKDTIDYTTVYGRVKELVENHRFSLLEALGAHIGDSILQLTNVSDVTVRIRKPAVPMRGQIDYVEVQITRSNKK